MCAGRIESSTPPEPRQFKVRLEGQTLLFTARLSGGGFSIGIPGEPRLKSFHVTSEPGSRDKFWIRHFTLGSGRSAEHVYLPSPTLESWGRPVQLELARRARTVNPDFEVYVMQAPLAREVREVTVPTPTGGVGITDLARVLGTGVRLDLHNPKRWKPVPLCSLGGPGILSGIREEGGRAIYYTPINPGTAGRFTERQFQCLHRLLYGEMIGITPLMEFAATFSRTKRPSPPTVDYVRSWIQRRVRRRTYREWRWEDPPGHPTGIEF